MPPLFAVAKITGERGCRVGKKASLRRFLADQKIANSWGGKNAFWGILWHKQRVIACCQTHSDYGPPKMSSKLAV